MANKHANARTSAPQRAITRDDMAFIADMLHVAAQALREVRTSANSIMQAFEHRAQRAEALADAIERAGGMA